MNKTKIETADYTWNPSTGCDNICFDGDCYAYQMIKRFGNKWGYDWKPRLHKDRLNEPLNQRNPSLIFAPSMGDPMTPSLKDNEILEILSIMNKCSWHRFQVQTKFAERLPKFKYPISVWLGVSLCYERDLERLEYLKETNARIKYAYCEPLLEELKPDFNGIDWVVIGAKTGSHPFQPKRSWIHKLTANAIKADAEVFHKPNLNIFSPLRQFPDEEFMRLRK